MFSLRRGPALGLVLLPLDLRHLGREAPHGPAVAPGAHVDEFRIAPQRGRVLAGEGRLGGDVEGLPEGEVIERIGAVVAELLGQDGLLAR